jgi:predicted nucleic acid-binding protein
MPDARRWVMDTSTYTHLCRAGHSDLIKSLAPSGVVLIPADVNDEIERGREAYPDIPAVSSTGWAETVVLTEDEVWTQLQIKAQMGGGPAEHLGECAVLAHAHRRGLIAVVDEREAVTQAERLGVPVRDTMWIIVEAYKKIYGKDRDRAAQVVDDLLGTGMYLPVRNGESLFAWAYEEGLLP